MQLTFLCLKLCEERSTGLRAIAASSYKQPNKLSQLQKSQLNLLTDYVKTSTKVPIIHLVDP